MLIPPHEGGGELVGGDGVDDPLPGVHDAVLAQANAHHLLLHFYAQEEDGRSQIRLIVGVFEALDGVGGDEILQNGGSMHGCILSVEKHLLISL